ncbi:NAD(P)/FAD-dependent oxidoreductase [Peptoniphilus equinus]|uniref:NAD(P)/FAD-dependent oxidoreductase n=1 Tax=Peptoniphilus equinus TaxID=3016343 RepID=A0ABY7QU99_9FIRM|nr:NAD(P)/FAD-dependent oxidoreductase [Peptoniphilus equinus]WBW49936.1 NAD(P)/FAD-dependent oxidoreductase [Peptoniphilus equinus]
MKLIVIGAGPAGVCAALYGKSRGLDVTVLEKEQVGGIIGHVSLVSHFASAVVGESGLDFAKRLETQLQDAGIAVLYEEVTALDPIDEGYQVTTKAGTYLADKVVVATGSTPKELPIDYPEGLQVHHFARGMEQAVQGKTVVVNGGSDGAVKEALYLAQFAKAVHIVQDQPQLMCIQEFKDKLAQCETIVVHTGTTLSACDMAEGKLVAVHLNGEAATDIVDDGGMELFVLIGQAGNGALVEKFVPLQNGYADAADLNVAEGLYVAGDVRVKAVRQVATAVSDGCLAGVDAAK